MFFYLGGARKIPAPPVFLCQPHLAEIEDQRKNLIRVWVSTSLDLQLNTEFVGDIMSGLDRFTDLLTDSDFGFRGPGPILSVRFDTDAVGVRVRIPTEVVSVEQLQNRGASITEVFSDHDKFPSRCGLFHKQMIWCRLENVKSFFERIYSDLIFIKVETSLQRGVDIQCRICAMFGAFDADDLNTWTLVHRLQMILSNTKRVFSEGLATNSFEDSKIAYCFR